MGILSNSGLLRQRVRPLARAALRQTRRAFNGFYTATLAPFPQNPGVLFVGYAEGEFGLGQSFRNMVTAAATTDVPFSIYPFNFHLDGRRGSPFMAERYATAERRHTTIFEFSPDQINEVLSRLDPRLFLGSHKVLRTYWELPAAPAAWRKSLSIFDELWAPNDFVANAFRDVFSGPIIVVRPCIDVAAVDRKAARHKFGIDDNEFTFLFTFDYASYPARKNPLGLVTAFRNAFPTGREGVRLIIKSNGNATTWPSETRSLDQAALEDPRIRLISSQLSRRSVLALIGACDCYVSLHRSEGFGQGIAEAMALGVAVIGTDFSGSTDLLTEPTGFPVSYTLRGVKQDEYPWSEGQSWAEPDLAQAAAIMRRVVADGAERNARASTAMKVIAAQHSPLVIGAAIAARLDGIDDSTAAPPVDASVTS